MWNIFAGGGFGCDAGKDFGACLVLNTSIICHKVKRPRQRQRRRLMPRHDKGQQIVAQLAGIHFPPCFAVFSAQQKIKQVGRCFAVAFVAVINDIIRDGFHFAQGFARNDPAPTWHPIRQAKDIAQ